MKKFVLAYNPVSGNNMFKKKLDLLVAMFQARYCILIPYRTSPQNTDFVEFIRTIKPCGIIIAGGDGTLNEIVNILLKNKITLPIAILPSGTSNDFASCLTLNAHTIESYIDSIVNGKTTPVDIGYTGNNYFINVASAGMLTCVAHNVDRRLKSTFGKLAYYLRGIGELPKFRALDMTIGADGKTERVSAFFVLIVNSSVVAGLKNVSVNARLNDGKLDLILLKQCSIPELVTFAAETVAGKPACNNKNIAYIQASSFEINCSETVQSDIDGEPGPKLPLKIETIPAAIDVYIR
ncbi:diacylglycerol/lipid kinase family protein [Pectinatus frisingensis]|jgi:YegS/Rv2252/BmrU family lipid kinase|uniref:diacylglycerol/lipid kinase family protein n=1 Tax=Pectinatus frisingensis TaxID=865 RepID=UPI0015F46B78|nr:YegS/Rv2252/BmrU family lipid kinase [Pectinatus frisingensis]